MKSTHEVFFAEATFCRLGRITGNALRSFGRLLILGGIMDYSFAGRHQWRNAVQRGDRSMSCEAGLLFAQQNLRKDSCIFISQTIGIHKSHVL